MAVRAIVIVASLAFAGQAMAEPEARSTRSTDYRSLLFFSEQAHVEKLMGKAFMLPASAPSHGVGLGHTLVHPGALVSPADPAQAGQFPLSNPDESISRLQGEIFKLEERNHFLKAELESLWSRMAIIAGPHAQATQIDARNRTDMFFGSPRLGYGIGLAFILSIMYGFLVREHRRRPMIGVTELQSSAATALLLTPSSGGLRTVEVVMSEDKAKHSLLHRLPAPPAPMDIGSGVRSNLEVFSAEDVATVKAEIVARRQTWEAQMALNRQVSALCAQATSSMQYGMREAAAKTLSEVRQLLDEQEVVAPHKKGSRPGAFSPAYAEYVKLEGLECFIQTGKCLTRNSLGDMIEDEEYISGVISVCQELKHYALRRAIMLDAVSVTLCRNFISDVKAELLGFDFRNGPLRRKFDSVKYAERYCQDLLYELSFTDSNQIEPAGDEGGRMISNVVDKVEWTCLREAYLEYDQKREMVIKACREPQKEAKQAIYEAHRGDLTQALTLIGCTQEKIKAIWCNHVQKLPTLRHGSFVGALEELAEAELFVAWLGDLNHNANHALELGELKSYVLPRRTELACGFLEAHEYLGALSDFTGEVGRVAVEAATRRDREAVRHCLRYVYAAHSVLTSVAQPQKEDKKLEATARNLRKLETIEYDLAVRTNTKGPPPRLSQVLAEGMDEGDGGEL